MATLTWHASKYKIHKLHQRYILWKWSISWGCTSGGVLILYLPTCQASSLSWLKSFMLVVFIWCLWVEMNSLPCWFCTGTLGLALFEIVVHRQAKTYPPLASHQGWWWHTWFQHCTFWWHWHFQQSLKTMVRNNQSTHQLILVLSLFFFSLLSVLVH